jgi:hypothetical protein
MPRRDNQDGGSASTDRPWSPADMAAKRAGADEASRLDYPLRSAHDAFHMPSIGN